MGQIELFNHLLRIIIIISSSSSLKPYNDVQIICIRLEYLISHNYVKWNS